MDVLKNILSEADVMYMSDATLISLGKLVDDKLAKRLKKYLDDSEGYYGVKNRIKELIGATIETALFHEVALERGIVDLVSKINLETLAFASIDIDKYIEELIWLKEHKSFIKSYIEPRRKTDFDDFVRGLRELEVPDEVPHYKDVVKRVTANSMVFYSRNERPRATRIGILITMSDTWEMALKGLQYLQFCNKKGIIGYLCKEF